MAGPRGGRAGDGDAARDAPETMTTGDAGASGSEADGAIGPRPRTPTELHLWIAETLGVRVPTRALVDEHAAPFDYVCHAFFDGGVPGEGVLPVVEARSPDCVVWANRGGRQDVPRGGGDAARSGVQAGDRGARAGRVARAGQADARAPAGADRGSDVRSMVDGRITEKRVRLTNGSRAEVLAQSQTSVRGTRVQKLRCDEVELFDPRCGRRRSS
jgi:hypothetical protein